MGFHAVDKGLSLHKALRAAHWLDVGQTVGTVGALAQQVELDNTNIETVDGKVVAQASTLNALRAATRDDRGNGAKIDALKGWSSTAATPTSPHRN